MIKKKLALFFLLLIGVGLYVFLSKGGEISAQDSEILPLECDLNIKDCEILFNNKKIKFNISPKPIYTMKPVVFNIYGLENFGFKNPSLEFYGLNMDMGKIKAKLNQENDKYSSKIVLSACLINVMRYRFEVLENGEKTGIFIDFDLRI